MKTRNPVWIRWMAAALFPAVAMVAAAAVAADEPEKRDEKRPERRQEKREERREPRRTEQQPARQPSGPAAPERQAAPAPVQRQTPPPAATERRQRIESQPTAPQERRASPNFPSNAPVDRRPERMSPPPRNVEVVRRPGGDRVTTRSSMGSRTVVVERPDRTVIVSRAPGRGYVQRPIVIANTTYVQRTYVHNSVVMTRVYRPYAYRGVTFAVYTPVRYYPPPFYAWTYSPWRTPVRYSWGWYGDPWYGYYRGYFAPYPVYSSPALWLTDYLIASTLQAAYMDRMAERRAAAYNAYTGDSMPLSPEVKQAIATEVQQQIQYERDQAQNQGGMAPANGLPPTLADNRRHLFVVDRGLDVANLNMGGQTCSISEGDVLQMDGPAPGNADTADVMVVSAKPGSCGRGSTVSVYLSDLSEMQNQLRQTVDQGMEELRAKQGQGGLPALPANLASAPTTAPFAQQLPPPDPNAAREVQQQYIDPPAQDSQAGSQGPAPTIALGQSIDQVIGILGQPKSIADLGSKKVYVFNEFKVTFVDGRVTDVQ